MKKYKISRQTLNEVNNKYDSKLVNGTMLPTWAGVISWVWEHGSESGLTLDSFIQGQNMVLNKDYENNTITFNSTGGGGSAELFTITANFDYREQTITIETAFKQRLQEYFALYGYYPIVKLILNIIISGTIYETHEILSNDVRLDSSWLIINFIREELGIDGDYDEIQQIIAKDNGAVLNASYTNFSTNSFASNKYYDSRTIDKLLSNKANLSEVNDLTGRVSVNEQDISDLKASVSGHTTSIEALNSNKQNKTDEALTTTDKTIVGAINYLASRTQPRYTHNVSINNIPAKSPFTANATICLVLNNKNVASIQGSTQLFANLDYITNGQVIEGNTLATMLLNGKGQLSGIAFVVNGTQVVYTLTDLMGAEFQDIIIN